MVRSTLTALALAVASVALAGHAQAQQPATVTHVVRQGETMAILAHRYLGNPQRWPEIAALNPEVTDPDRIDPGLVLRLPAPVRAASAERRLFGVGKANGWTRDMRRSVFYGADRRRQGIVAVHSGAQPRRLAVPIDVFYSAAWLEPGVARPGGQGTLRQFVRSDEARRFHGMTARPFDRITLERADGFMPEEGEELQVFRVDRHLPGWGWVVTPTGSVRVLSNEGSASVVEVNRQFAPMSLGDHVRVVPRFPLRPGQLAVDVTPGSLRARIVAWAEPHELPQFADVAFLDVGTRDGVQVGDEFVVAARTDEAFDDATAGRLQVVGVGDEVSSARVLQMDGPVFDVGVEVVLARKVR